MKKLLTLTFILLLVMAAALMATDTRVYTMGDNNNILLDDANIWLYPSRTFEYPNIAVAEFGADAGLDKAITQYDFYRFGAHWKFGSDQPRVLGTYFSNVPAITPTDLEGGNLINFNYNVQSNSRIDLFYGQQITDYNFGAHLNLVHSSQDRTGNPPAFGNAYKEGFGYYNLDLGLTPKTGKWDVALDVGIGSWTQEDTAGIKLTEPDGYMDLSVMGRYFVQQGPNYTLIPHVGFGYAKRGAKHNQADGTLNYTQKYTTTGFDLGCGWNYTPATNVLAVLDFGIQYYKWKHDYTPGAATDTAYTENDTYTTIPYFKIGLDADVFKWLDFRAGATSYWDREKWEPGTNETEKYNYAANQTYLGFGFHWNRLHVDTYTDPEVFLNGFNFISGANSGQMNLRISALYEMM